MVIVAILGWYFLQPQMARLSPERLPTHASGANAILGDALVDVAPHSSLLVRSHDPRAPRLFLEDGEATFDVVPRRQPPASFEVSTSDLLILATDARFAVTRHRERSSLTVERGVVDVEANGRRFRVRGGERWPSPRDSGD